MLGYNSNCCGSELISRDIECYPIHWTFIGTVLGSIIVIAAHLYTGIPANILLFIILVVAAFLFTQLIDNVIFQPLILWHQR